MPTLRELRSLGRDWLASLLAFSMLLTGGCPRNGGVDDGDGKTGGIARGTMYINDDAASAVQIAGRNDANDSFYVFGTRSSTGRLEEVESIVIQQANGDRSFVIFESGRPVHIQGPDGSYAHVEYQEISSTRLAGSIDLFDAATGNVETYTADIDLQQTLANVAALVEQSTGRSLDVVAVSGDDTLDTGKSRDRSSVITIIPLYAVMVIPFVAAVGIMTVILGQIVYAIAAAVTAAIEAVVLAAFLPLFIIGELLGDTVLRIRVIPLTAVFTLPDFPTVILF